MPDQTKFNSQLEVTQTATLGGSLSVSGTTTFNDQVAIVATDDTVSIVATGVSITASTTITGAVCIYGDTKVQGTVTITGNTAISGTVTITGDLKADSLQLNLPSDRLTEILTRSIQLHFPNVAGDSVATTNIVVSGALSSSFNSVLVDTPDILDDAFIVQATVVSDDTVGLKLHNTSNGTLTAITATYEIVVFQFT
jgi:hypothetical protein